MKEYRTIKSLRAGGVVDLYGIKFVMDNGEIKHGDLYIAERNTGPKLLTAKEVIMTVDGSCINFIHATTTDYSFDGHECVKVREA
jgi:hypothetical protein